MKKTITHFEHPRHMHMVGDGFRVANYLPWYAKTMEDDIASPFIMLDYNAPWSIPPQKDGYRPGVGFHPHRGFETVTVVYSWEVEHQDTAGGGGVIGPDEVQWMTAGSGLLHNEFMTERFSRAGGIQHAVQLWVNLPSKYKMVEPRYQTLTRESIPEVDFLWWRVRVIAGEYHSAVPVIPGLSRDPGQSDTTGFLHAQEWQIHSWPAETFSAIELYDIRFDTEGEFATMLPEWYTTAILITEGNIMIADKIYHHGDMLHFSKGGEGVSFTGNPNTKVLLMAGEPLGEPVAHYWPFVMNTEEEIQQAMRDYNAGKFERK